MKRQALRALMVLLALLFAPLTAFAQGAVQQSGPVVSGHAPLWFQNGVIGDAGTATNPLITTLGVHNPNPDSFCINDGTNNALPTHALCLGINDAGSVGQVDWSPAGAGPPWPLNFNVNGTTPLTLSAAGATIPTLIGPLAITNLATGAPVGCFGQTASSQVVLTSCGGGTIPTVVCSGAYSTLAACYAALPSSGGEMWLPPNTTFVQTTGLTISNPNVAIVCSGWSSVIQRGAALTTGPLSLSGTGNSISDCTIDGNVANTTANTADLSLIGQSVIATHVQAINANFIAVSVAGAYDTLQNSTVIGKGANANIYGVWAINHQPGIKILGNTITATGIDAIGIDGDGFVVANNVIYGDHCYTGQSGGQLATYWQSAGPENAQGGTIQGNYIGKGCVAGSSALEIQGVGITAVGNNIENQWGGAVTLEAGTTLNFVANVVRNSGQGGGSGPAVYVVPGVSGWGVVGNKLVDDQTTHTQTTAVSIGAGASDNFTITNNDTRGVTGFAILDNSTGTNKIIGANLGIDNVIPNVYAPSGVLTLPDNPVVLLPGIPTITSVAASNTWTGRQLTVIPASTATFTAGGNIANSFTSIANVPFSMVYNGTTWNIGGGGGGGGGGGTVVTLQTTAVSPTAPTSTSAFAMQGIGATITPAITGFMYFTINGTAYGSASAATQGIRFQPAFGTGAVPANGAAPTGTVTGTTEEAYSPSAVLVAMPFSTTAVVAVTGGTTYWIDAIAESVGAPSLIGLANVTVSAMAVPATGGGGGGGGGSVTWPPSGDLVLSNGTNTPAGLAPSTNGLCAVVTSGAWALGSCGGGGGSGTVTSVAMTVPSWLTVTGSPVTTSGTLAVTAAAGLTANEVLATPNGSSGALSVRALLAADLPSDVSYLDVPGVFTAPQSSHQVVTCTGGICTPAAAQGQNIEVDLNSSCPCTLANPTGSPTAITAGMFVFVQDATGGRAVSFGSSYSGGSGVVINPTANAATPVAYAVVPTSPLTIALSSTPTSSTIAIGGTGVSGGTSNYLLNSVGGTLQQIAVGSLSIAYTQLPSLAANYILGSIAGGTPIGLPMTSCYGGSSAVTFQPGTGFGCNTISAGGQTINVSTITGATSGYLLYTDSSHTLQNEAVSSLSIAISQLTGGPLAANLGGTGVANASGSHLTLGAALTTTGAATPTLAFGATTVTYTFPGVAGTLPVISGGPTAGHCVEWASALVIEDAGAACGTGGGGGTLTPGTTATSGGAAGGVMYDTGSLLQEVSTSAVVAGDVLTWPSSGTTPIWQAPSTFTGTNSLLAVNGTNAMVGIAYGASGTCLLGEGTAIVPAFGTTCALTNTAETITALWQFTYGDIALLGSAGGGYTTLGTTNVSATNYTASFPANTGTVLEANITDQAFSGGFAPTDYSIGTISSGTTTIDCGKGPGQYLTNNGAFTLAPPAASGQCTVLVINGSSAGTITFSAGWSEGSNTGDTLNTINTDKFMLTIARIDGLSHYLVTALQP